MAVLFALVSMAFAGINDVVFKRYALSTRARGTYLFGIGCVWLTINAAGAAALQGTGDGLRWNALGLGVGLVGGALLALSNLGFIESLARIPVSLGATIYRLNTIGVVLLSVLLLGESLGLLRGAGIVLGVLAVLLLYERGHTAASHIAAAFVGLAVAAALLRAAFAVLAKWAVIEGADARVILTLAPLAWIAIGAAYAHQREGRFRITRQKAHYALASGALIAVVAGGLMFAIERGDASLVVPIANLSFAVSLLISVGLGMERLSLRKLAALGCAALALFALAGG